MKQVFKSLPQSEANKEMCDKMLKSVVCRVERFEITRSRRRSMESVAVSMVAVVVFIPTIVYVMRSVYASGFGRYLSLIWSDSTYVTSNISDFLMSTLTSLPLMGAILVFTILFVLAHAIKRAFGYSEYAEKMQKRLTAA